MFNDIKSISRRTFVAGTVAAGAFTAPALKAFNPEEPIPDIAAATGDDPAKNTRAVIDAMGGIGEYVKPGNIVGILPNSQGIHPGCSTHPTVIKTVVDICKAAGAKEVHWYAWHSGRYRQMSNLDNHVADSGAILKHVPPEEADLWETLDIPRGIALKKVRVFKAYKECDVFISMPIVKDHIGSRFTGVLKNYMGVSHPGDNRPFHPTFEGDDLLHMEQCIADLNLAVRPPDLVIMDAMEILTTNGPMGPGKISSPKKVIAAKDRVAIDSYAATLLELEGPKVTMIANAFKHGLGEIDLAKVTIKEIST
jgi:uncharacterized protein (DUF362 family)